MSTHRLWIASIFCILLSIAVSSTAHARDVEPIQSAWSPGPLITNTLSGVAGSAVGSFAGGYIGFELGASLTEREGWGALGDMFFGSSIGILIANPLGAATGVYLAGEANGLNGSWLASLGGSTAGVGLALGTLYIIDQNHIKSDASLLFFGLLFPAIGATVGYGLSSKTLYTASKPHPPREIRTALVHFNRKEGFALSPPAIGTGVDEEGGLKISVPLFGGTF